MRQKRCETEIEAPTVRLLGDLGSGRRSSAVSTVMADESRAITFLQLRALKGAVARTEGPA
jgi:hypothetical protein